MKQAIKLAIARLWQRARPGTGARLRVPVLCYHSVNDTGNAECDPLPSALFESHLQHLRAHYTPISLAELADALNSGASIPPDAVVVTFDDGYRDNFEVAYPLLSQYRIPATFFIVPGFLDGEVDLIGDPGWEAMSWENVLSMDADPLVEFGAHTQSHPILSTLSETQARHEISKSKAELQRRLGHVIEFFAYPYGQGEHVGPAALAEVARQQFSLACSTIWRTTHAQNERYFLNRIMITSDDTVEVLDLKLRGGFDYIYYLHRIRALALKLRNGRGVALDSAYDTR
ncbi:hypothetical protein ASD04_12675 [Devosia sp. Root436]|uniref:polysaccharide deacetylase family protein n=1 Tax=Devosia sp. Root436 TaxID=1736537 RepID=UPI0006F5BF5F|nr:polysaccharide deacetylase family protein [Devosia sp. Root436]KQX35639.1 hypothetical protein ASD04_12675 [Devosia sp. Root436]